MGFLFLSGVYKQKGDQLLTWSDNYRTGDSGFKLKAVDVDEALAQLPGAVVPYPRKHSKARYDGALGSLV